MSLLVGRQRLRSGTALTPSLPGLSRACSTGRAPWAGSAERCQGGPDGTGPFWTQLLDQFCSVVFFVQGYSQSWGCRLLNETGYFQPMFPACWERFCYRYVWLSSAIQISADMTVLEEKMYFLVR